MNFSKCKSKDKRKRREEIEKKILQLLENNLDNCENRNVNNLYKDELSDILENISGGVRIRSRCQWYKKGEKSSNFFLNLEKKEELKELLLCKGDLSEKESLGKVRKPPNVQFKAFCLSCVDLRLTG